MENTRKQSPITQFIQKWQGIERTYEEYAKSKGLTYMSFNVLQIIYENMDNCTQKLICEQIFYTKQSVNAIIKTFWEQGYVELKEEPTDRRNKRIIFTQKGRAYADEIIGGLVKIENKAMKHLSTEQWEQLLAMAETYEKHFLSGITELMDTK